MTYHRFIKLLEGTLIASIGASTLVIALTTGPRAGSAAYLYLQLSAICYMVYDNTISKIHRDGMGGP
jgi:hypothetical protein